MPVRQRGARGGSKRDAGAAGDRFVAGWKPNINLPSLGDTFLILTMGPDQNMVTKRPYNWSPGLILVDFCTIFRARPI